MQLTRNVFTIADLNRWMDDKSLIVNRDYQRTSGLWPKNARSFFIDTILNGFPFPKVVLRQIVDLKTKKSIREIIDGQQRLMAIHDFIGDEISVSKVSAKYKGFKFSDLEKEDQQKFLSYEVSVDTVTSAQQEEILEIFRRINSYMLPLNDPEHRHATYQGEFKWFIKDMIDKYTPLFESFHILSLKQISRMSDADLMTELCQILMTGIQDRSKQKLDVLYRENDDEFKEKNDVKKKLDETLNFIKNKMYRVLENRVLEGYSFYSLFSALVYNKWGIKNIQAGEMNGLRPVKQFVNDLEKAGQNILELYMAVDQKDVKGKFSEFVRANIATTHRVTHRKIRLKWLVEALQDKKA